MAQNPLIAALEHELADYLRRGKADRAAQVRQELARRPEWLRGVKVVVWEFAERDLLSAETEWAKVALPR